MTINRFKIGQAFELFSNIPFKSHHNRTQTVSKTNNDIKIPDLNY